MFALLCRSYIPCYPCPVVDDDAILGDGSVRLTSEEDKIMLGADVGAEAARKDVSFQEEGVKELADLKKEKHWRDGGEF